MIEDFKKSIQAVFYERISSPLSGAFCLSWVAWNWKLLYTLFFGNGCLSTKEKFSNLSEIILLHLNTYILYIPEY